MSLCILTTFMFLEKQKKLVDLNCKLMIKQGDNMPSVSNIAVGAAMAGAAATKGASPDE